MSNREKNQQVKIVCPKCHSDLIRQPDRGLVCMKCGSKFPSRAKVDVLLSDDEWQKYQEEIALHGNELDEYILARRQALLTNMYYDMWVSRLLSKLPDGFSGSLLEIMAGGCEISRRLPFNITNAAAIDRNLAFIEQANDDFISNGEKRIVTLCGLAEELPFMDANFDVVIVQGGLHHVRPILPQVLSEIYRVLRPNGYFIASEPANDFWFVRQIRQFQYKKSEHQGYDEGEDGFTQLEITELLSSKGLKLLTYERFGLLAYIWMGNLDVWPLLRNVQWRWLGKILITLDALLEKAPVIREFSWASIFRAQKGS